MRGLAKTVDKTVDRRPYSRGRGGGEVIPPQDEATAFFARMTPAPSADAQTAINSLYYRLKQCGAYPLIDALYLGVAEAEAHIRLNLKSASFAMTATNVPTFAANQGFYGNGTSHVYNCNFIPSTAGGNFTQNNASIATYILDDRNENLDDVGSDNVCIRSRFQDGSNNPVMVARINQVTSSTVDLPPSKTGSGLCWASRDDANTIRVGKGRTKLATVSVASSALSANSVLFGGGRSVTNPGFSKRRQGALIIGASLTDAMWQAISDALDEYMAAMQVITWTMNSAAPAQVLQGIGIELQSDSIEGDGGGIQESNTASLPLGLSASEQTRFASQVMGFGSAGGFVDFRLAMGLYYRGTSSDGKQFRERLPGQNAAIKAMCDATGVGIAFTHWSPPPYYKQNTVSGTTYHGSTYPRPDPVSDPTGYNTYLRRLLQGGSLDAPDKVADPTGYAAWMTAFATDTVASMEYIHQNVGPVRKFVAQNEPLFSTTYPSCVWTNQQMYDYLKVVVPLIRASSILSTYGGQANTVAIVSDDLSGQTGVGSTLIKADSALLAEISAWSWHKIDEVWDANYIFDNFTTLTANASSKPVYSSENEYFDPRVDPSQTRTYMEPGHRMTNLAMQVMSWMRNCASPIWYPIHIGKPSTGPVFETDGRAMTIWRPTGAPVRADYPNLQEGQFDFVKVNWHAVKGFLAHGIKGSTRIPFTSGNNAYERECYGMAFVTAGGKYVAAFSNRSRKATGVKAAGLPAGTYKRMRYDLISGGLDMGAVANGDRVLIPADTIEFFVQQ
ncbi:hypothetical protein [Rhizobium lentis]|uniref:Uncharacterized protein n=1 Tax=Rhizobium lentis TaxID=1138194 RepID=A0A7W8XEJ5_9HYPH|nr:hypothetical protein [Rhizobium lentis]MBB4574373.1 hypothetical protein [Rhizobium lentis]MBB5550299.1 hypothetical protein [Rhizobium lentis]MBB5560672.1 hypothetical protein [Rhizobium lentis]MBB5567257.1 hypothetical protein [Rhizobium lentis]